MCQSDCSACSACPPGCDTCSCTPGTDPSGCRSGETCTSACACAPSPSCATDLLALVNDQRWCDPFEPGWCPNGTTCTVETCSCTYCGDGLVNGSEGCESGFAGGDCPAGQPCTDCKCQSNCGNGSVDPGEHCDPGSTASAVCDVGYSCSPGCSCEQATCGDYVCDRNAGENEQSCPGDCAAVQCCIDTGGCPSEEPYSCPGDCCCCGPGATCVPSGAWVCGI
jgi:hypothetical protein